MAESLKDIDQSMLWICGIDGCRSEPVIEIVYPMNMHQDLRLSSCKDINHQNIITIFLKEKADIGNACLEWADKGMKLDDEGPSKIDHEHRLMETLLKYMEKLEKGKDE